MGIDYGRYPLANGNLPNRDESTGIRYGIIPRHRLQYWAAGEFEPIYDECEKCADPEWCECEMETSGWVYDRDGLQMQLTEFSNEVWIFSSPHTAMGSHCSLCAPGAVYLDGTGTDALGYCPPPEWMADE